MTEPETPRVAVAIVTFRRRESLARLLAALARLTFAGQRPALSYVVIDNDPDGSAREVCAAAPAAIRASLHYAIEARRGIAQARNAALAAISPGTEFVAFIDDDEEPEPGWLDALLTVQRRTGADGVAGPVLPRLPADAPRWLVEGRFFERPRRATGSVLPELSTNNLLLRLAALQGLGPVFDDRYGLTGGSDRHLGVRLQAAGRLLVWADEALVTESIPASRANARWLLRRAFRVGNTLALNDVDLASSPAARLRRAIKAAGRLAFSLVALVRAPFHPAGLVAGVLVAGQGACRSAGMIAGLIGHRYEEYRVVHPA